MSHQTHIEGGELAYVLHIRWRWMTELRSTALKMEFFLIVTVLMDCAHLHSDGALSAVLGGVGQESGSRPVVGVGGDAALCRYLSDFWSGAVAKLNQSIQQRARDAPASEGWPSQCQ